MPAAPQTLSTLAVRYLRERIANGTLRPGARLSDLALSKEIGISRTPIREAIRLLAADGLVEVVPHQGATVRAPSYAELDELYEIRGLLEAHAAARAATHRTTAEGAALLALAAEMAAIPRPAAGRLSAAATAHQRELDLAFHRQVLALSGQARLRRLVEDAGVIARPFETMDDRLTAAELESACHHHRAIAQAIADGDAERARHTMAAHIGEGRAGLKARMGSWQQTHADELPAALRPFASPAD